MGVVATPFDICSQAMLAIGANTIASFDGDTPESKVCAALYPTSLEAALQRFPWSFATVFARTLNRLDETPDDPEYSYAHQLPGEVLQLMRVYFTNSYRIEGRKLLSMQQNVQIDYIRQVSEQDFPAYFVRALAYDIALRATIPLTEDNRKMEAMAEMVQYEWQRAQFDDSKQRSQVCYIDDGGLIESRMNGYAGPTYWNGW